MFNKEKHGEMHIINDYRILTVHMNQVRFVFVFINWLKFSDDLKIDSNYLVKKKKKICKVKIVLLFPVHITVKNPSLYFFPGLENFSSK